MGRTCLDAHSGPRLGGHFFDGTKTADRGRARTRSFASALRSNS